MAEPFPLYSSLGIRCGFSCYINFYIKVTDSTIPQVTEVPPHSVTQHILPSGDREVSFVQPFRERPAGQRLKSTSRCELLSASQVGNGIATYSALNTF